jgi:hypothetical protein
MNMHAETPPIEILLAEDSPGDVRLTRAVLSSSWVGWGSRP